ncbi:unnamed protein product [Adineta steineri]|uniref:Helix-turn-helix domain-containing protein n=2 Tax=Adineta steineri TaxID=433720 RepID=A0A813V007_9BILA|nr:unnamed protein product [Adineta steineri]
MNSTADNQNTFYLGEAKVFDATANEYLLKSDAYKVLRTIVKEEDKQEWQNDLNARIEAMNDALQILKRRKALDKNVVDTLITDLNKVKLPYLYFLPDVSKGSPNTMTLSDTLANIYLFDWQKLILKEVQRKNEFFGRYKDEIFFTWNDSDHVLRTYLQAVQNVQNNVHFQISIGSSVRFFGAHVENRQGQLYTRVHHDLFMQNYTLPYVVGHTKLKHSNYLRAALLRAVCYCSLVEDFHRERIHLELSYLMNGYSLLFVESHVQNFFNYFRLDNMRYRTDQTIYHSFRRQWFDLLDIQHTLSDQLQQFDDHGNVIRFHYLYDYGPRCQFNQQFHELWSKYFCHHPVFSTERSEILLTTKQLHSLNALLARHKSSIEIQ